MTAQKYISLNNPHTERLLRENFYRGFPAKSLYHYSKPIQKLLTFLSRRAVIFVEPHFNQTAILSVLTRAGYLISAPADMP